MKYPTASVIISALNEADRLPACLESLLRQRTKTPFDIHVVDNGSTDETFAVARSWSKKSSAQRAIWVWRQRKQGSPAARNFGARKARGELLLFTDADCTFSPEWVEQITKPFRKGQAYPLGAIAGLTESGFSSTKGPNWIERYADEKFQFWEKDRLARFPAFLPWAPTCNLAVQRDLFRELGAFDEIWTSAAYDVDFCWRLALAGYVLGYAPKAKVVHYRRSALFPFLRQMRNYSRQNASLHRLYQQALKMPRWRSFRERMAASSRQKGKRLLRIYEPRQMVHWFLDQLTDSAMLLGKVSSLEPMEKSPLQRRRSGGLPNSRLPRLPKAYEALRRAGWIYWCYPANWEEDPDLILYRPTSGERFALNASAHTVLRIKAEGMQSEDAARALGQDPHDSEVLTDIDHLTLDLRTQRLLL